jgi:hypothetical protein
MIRTAPPTRIPTVKSADRMLMATPCRWPQKAPRPKGGKRTRGDERPRLEVWPLVGGLGLGARYVQNLRSRGLFRDVGWITKAAYPKAT